MVAIKVGNIKLAEEFEVDIFMDEGLYAYNLYINGEYKTMDSGLKTVAKTFDSILKNIRGNEG